MKESCGLEPREVVHMMLVTQYLDVLKEFAQSGKATMVVPHGMSAVADMEQQVRVCVHECVCVCDCKRSKTNIMARSWYGPRLTLCPPLCQCLYLLHLRDLEHKYLHSIHSATRQI
jgi:hypothetical protein